MESAGALELLPAEIGLSVLQEEQRKRELGPQLIGVELERPVPLRKGRFVLAGGVEVPGQRTVQRDVERTDRDR